MFRGPTALDPPDQSHGTVDQRADAVRHLADSHFHEDVCRGHLRPLLSAPQRGVPEEKGVAYQLPSGRWPVAVEAVAPGFTWVCCMAAVKVFMNSLGSIGFAM
jgi:hypothetical protein